MLRRICKNDAQNLQIRHAEFAIFLAQNSDVPSHGTAASNSTKVNCKVKK